MENWTVSIWNVICFNMKIISFVLHEFIKYNRYSGAIFLGVLSTCWQPCDRRTNVNTVTSYCFHILTLQCYCEMMSQYHSPQRNVIFYFHVRSKKQLARESHSNNNQETLNSGGSRFFFFWEWTPITWGGPNIFDKKFLNYFHKIQKQVRTGQPPLFQC